MWKNHLKIALKVLLRRKFITAVSLLGIAFTLTVLMVAAAVVDHWIGPHPPETRGDRLLKVKKVFMADEKFYKGEPGGVHSDAAGPGFVRHVRKLRTPEKIAVYERNRPQATYQGGEKLLLDVMATDAAYWEIMEFDFLEGRPFTADEVAAMSEVAVIDRKTGAALFPGQPAVGQILETDRKPVSSRRSGPDHVPEGSRGSVGADMWVPLQPYHPGMAQKYIGGLNLLLLARDPGDFLGDQEGVRSDAGSDRPVEPPLGILHQRLSGDGAGRNRHHAVDGFRWVPVGELRYDNHAPNSARAAIEIDPFGSRGRAAVHGDHLAESCQSQREPHHGTSFRNRGAQELRGYFGSTGAPVPHRKSGPHHGGGRCRFLCFLRRSPIPDGLDIRHPGGFRHELPPFSRRPSVHAVLRFALRHLPRLENVPAPPGRSGEGGPEDDPSFR